MTTTTGSPRAEALAAARRGAAACTACSLHELRTNSVFGCGNPHARIVWVGEGAGPDEDRQGEPFTGRSGQLLTRIIAAMGMARSDMWLTNVVCCRLGDDRRLTKGQIDACRHHLETQIEIIDPGIIVPLGWSAWRWFEPKAKGTMADVRGRVYRWHRQLVTPTYHPAFLLRKAEFKRDVWEDVKQIARLARGAEPEEATELKDHRSESRGIDGARLF